MRTGVVQGHPDFVEDIARESPLGLVRLGFRRQRALLAPVRHLELHGEFEDPTLALLTGPRLQ